VHHLPGVGENLQDHLQLRCVFKVSRVRTMNMVYHSDLRCAVIALDYALRRRGPLTMAPSQLGAFARSSAYYETPNLEFHIQPLSLYLAMRCTRFRYSPRACACAPTAGARYTRSSKPDDPPRIVTNYLSAPKTEKSPPIDRADAPHRFGARARDVPAGGIQAGRKLNDSRN
jgi:choline dehydrogenase-like flavoprotein